LNEDLTIKIKESADFTEGGNRRLWDNDIGDVGDKGSGSGFE
jgi:hypothetical protein